MKSLCLVLNGSHCAQPSPGSWQNNRLGDKCQTGRKSPCLSPGRQPDDKGELAPLSWQWWCQGTEESRQDVLSIAAECRRTEIVWAAVTMPRAQAELRTAEAGLLCDERSPSPRQSELCLEQASPESLPGPSMCFTLEIGMVFAA